MIDLCLKSFLSVRVLRDECDRKDDRVADRVHSGDDVVHGGGLDVFPGNYKLIFVLIQPFRLVQ